MTRPLRSTDPSHIGEYELIGRVGGGGMGDVFLGRSAGGRLAAVKVVRDLLADDARFRARFRREVEAARRVGGAYTAAVLGADPDAERPWLATAFIDGPSLAEKVAAEGPLDAGAVRRIGAGLAEALRELHRAGLVHRDLKPGNVLLAADGPRLIDFGIIRAEDGAGLTETGFVLGSAGYMAPEQAAGHEASTAADVYALGAVLTFAATGEGPFGSGAAPAVLLRQATAAPDTRGVPEGLRGVVDRCLAVDPDARPTTDDLLMLFSGDEPLPEVGTAFLDTALDTAPDTAPDFSPSDIIASTPTTVMPLKKTKQKPNQKRTQTQTLNQKSNQKSNQKPAKQGSKQSPKQTPTRPTPTRRTFLTLGALTAAVAGVGAGIAHIPGGDTKPTGGEVGSDSGADTGALLPTVPRPGAIGGPLRQPQWSRTVVDSVQVLTATQGALLVAGAGLTCLDTDTGATRWTQPKGPMGRSDIWASHLPVEGDVVYEQSSHGGELVALSTKDGAQVWSAPPPSDWYPGGLVGASPDLVVLWSSTTDGGTGHPGLWAADPRHQRPAWSTAVEAFEGIPYYNEAANLVVVSRPKDAKLAAYRADDGRLAWTADDTAVNTADQGQDSAFATALAGYGKTTYWATTRLYAVDENGKHVWPVGVTDSGDDGQFHAVIADADTVYAAGSVYLGSADVILAYKAEDGAPLWRAAWPKEFHNPSLECEMALGGGNLYVADRFSRTLVALDAATGKTLWQYHDPSPAKTEDEYWYVAADDTSVYIGYGDTVRAFTAK